METLREVEKIQQEIEEAREYLIKNKEELSLDVIQKSLIGIREKKLELLDMLQSKLEEATEQRDREKILEKMFT
jgi:hypothetical protein